MIDYYALLRLNRKEYKIMEINEEIGIIRVKLESTKNKVRCYTSAYSGIYNFETANL